jgi:hypothetical protein
MLATLSPGTAWGGDLLAQLKVFTRCRRGLVFLRAAFDLL